MADERSITEKLRGKVRIPAGSPVALGIGDDCAIYRPRGSADDLLLTTDLYVEGVHFRKDTHKPQEAGYKALARSLSDIAAMGGEPKLCLTALCAAEWTNEKWLDGFYKGLLELAQSTGTILAGGDLSRGGQFTCDVMVLGSVPRGAAFLRSGAKPGQDVYVSGDLGGAALGLETGKGKAWKRHVHPEPRLELAKTLREKYRINAAMDISDGLSLDLKRLALESGVAVEITAPPKFPGASLAHSLHGGEDYELLFTTRAGMKVPEKLCGVQLTRIGRVVTGPAGLVKLDGEPLEALGYDHFSPRETEK